MAEPTYRDALVALRRMGLVAEVAFTQLELLALGGDDLVDRATLTEEALGTLRRLGVRPLLERLAGLLTPATGAAVAVRG